MEKFKTEKSGKLSLYDCLNYFTVDETLSGDDQWYCSKCKTHVNAQKKMEVYKTPECLIIHLKRFSHSRGSMFGSSKKISDIVDFPVSGLDVTKFIVGKNKQKVLYDLYAVSNHMGSLSGGHYTAYAQNCQSKKWHEFDDTSVSRASESDLVGKAAYVLFYRKRM